MAETPYFGESSMIPNFGMALERALNPHGDTKLRVPFYMTSSWRKKLKIKGVSMRLNPNSVTFRQGKRITERDVQEGKIIFHWTNQRGQNNDILKLDFAGQTGNVNIRTGTRRSGFLSLGKGKLKTLSQKAIENLRELSEPETSYGAGVEIAGANVDKSGATKLANFHNLWSLTKEPIMDPKTGIPITYYITYSSTLFGNSFIVLAGHFNRVLDFADIAEEPFNKRWSFGFTVEGTIPSMDYIYSTVLGNLGREFMNIIEDQATR